MNRLRVAALAAALLLVPACSGDDSDDDSLVAAPGSDCPAATADAGSTDTDTKPVVQPDGAPPAQLEVTDIVSGGGEPAEAGDTVSMQYVGVLHEDGSEFDASWNRGETFEFDLGAGQVIPGWDQGIVGMCEGGRRQLVIPPELGYGEQGAGGVIPPGATLLFVVDLVEIAGP